MTAPRPLTFAYIVTAALLLTHEIDSAFWLEWNLFGLPGGLDVFLLLNFLIVLAVLYGLAALAQAKRAGLWLSVLLAAGGLFAAGIHAYFLLGGGPEFRAGGSLAILALLAPCSLVLLALTVRKMVGFRSA